MKDRATGERKCENCGQWFDPFEDEDSFWYTCGDCREDELLKREERIEEGVLPWN